MDYEQLGTSAVIQAISKTSKLRAFINNGDKEPSFDGHIYISNGNNSKENLRRVSVQVKGKGVEYDPDTTIGYNVSIIDLNNYMRNGGVMFFVVYIDKNTGDTKQIYYDSLPPYKIQELLREKKENKKTIKISFNSFPTNDVYGKIKLPKKVPKNTEGGKRKKP